MPRFGAILRECAWHEHCIGVKSKNQILELMKESVLKRVWLSALFAAAFCMAAVAQENPAVKQARQLQFNDQPTKAISVLNEAIKATPADASLLYNLGRAQIIAKISPKESEMTFQK